MAARYKKLYRIWSLRLSLGTALIVLALSWINEIKFFDLILRAGVSFGLIYLLTMGTLSLFEKAAPAQADDSQEDSEAECGTAIDFSVGDAEDEVLLASLGQDHELPGQVNRDLKTGLPSSEKQAEIVKRMGWN